MAFTANLFFIPSSDAQPVSIPPSPPTYSTSTVAAYIKDAAQQHGLNPIAFSKVIGCESNFDASAVGDQGTSFGIAQIHLPAHPDIATSSALDAEWSIDWMAQQWAAGHQGMWSCYHILYS